MKKLMIIAVIISGMLMPAQVFARNDRNDRNNRTSNGADFALVKTKGDCKAGEYAKDHSDDLLLSAQPISHNKYPFLVVVICSDS